MLTCLLYAGISVNDDIMKRIILCTTVTSSRQNMRTTCTHSLAHNCWHNPFNIIDLQRLHLCTRRLVDYAALIALDQKLLNLVLELLDLVLELRAFVGSH